MSIVSVLGKGNLAYSLPVYLWVCGPVSSFVRKEAMDRQMTEGLACQCTNVFPSRPKLLWSPSPLTFTETSLEMMIRICSPPSLSEFSIRHKYINGKISNVEECQQSQPLSLFALGHSDVVPDYPATDTDVHPQPEWEDGTNPTIAVGKMTPASGTSLFDVYIPGKSVW